MAWLITQGSPYKDASAKYQATHNVHGLIAAVAGTYATDPRYASMVSQIASQGNVAQAISTARQEASHAV
jgi:flagellum-specific peptidoglycan hydrolase FlgJ